MNQSTTAHTVFSHTARLLSTNNQLPSFMHRELKIHMIATAGFGLSDLMSYQTLGRAVQRDERLWERAAVDKFSVLSTRPSPCHEL